VAPAPAHAIEIRVRFGETDPYGVAYFASVLDYFKRGMDEYLRAAGIAPDAAYRNRRKGYGLPIVAVRCRYRAPVRFDDLLTLCTRVARVEERGVTFSFRLFRPQEGKDILAAEGAISCRAIDPSWRPIPLPADLRRALTGAR